jgi:hypothetical protein
VVDEAHVLLSVGVSSSSLVEVNHIALNSPAVLQAGGTKAAAEELSTCALLLCVDGGSAPRRPQQPSRAARRKTSAAKDHASREDTVRMRCCALMVRGREGNRQSQHMGQRQQHNVQHPECT